VLDGRLYVLDYDQQAKADTLRCLSLTDGQEIWRRGYYVPIKRNHGMSRTVPAVTDKHVVTIGPKCHVLCADAKTGQYLWGIDLVKQYGTTVPDWYTGQCPLIDQDRAIIAPGGSALMIAVDCQSGKVVWETPSPDGWLMTHSSVMPMTLGGTRMYVYCASGGVAGVSAETGRTLWLTTDWTVNMSNTPSPIVVGDGRLFLSGGYGAGSMMIQIVEQDGKFAVRELFRLKPDVFGSEQHTPVFYDGHIYGVKDNGELVCLDPSGKVVWTSGTNRFGGKGRGPYLIADGMLLILTAQGVLWLVEATPATFRPLASRPVLSGPEAWAPMALAGGRLIVRDLTGMVCLDMRTELTAKQP
jgi:outer membrane protein assembly factor BamB